MTHSTLNDQYFCRLHQTLVNALDGGELRTLCAKLNVNYDRLPGESKTDKAAALIASLHRDGRIHALLKASPELRNSARSEATSSSTANNPSPALTKMEQRKRFLRSFFPGQPIAFEEDLCNSWELIATRIIHKSGPDYVRQGITSLADDLAGVDFIADFELQEQESSQLDAQGKLRVEDQASQLDQAYVNYHSVCLWYRSVRSIVKLLLAPFTFIGILILCLVASFALPVIFVFGSTQAVPYAGDESAPELAYAVPESGDYYVGVKDSMVGSRDYMVGVLQSSLDVVTPDFSRANVWPLSQGEQVFSEIRRGQEHVYSIEGAVGETIVVEFYRWYADADMSFALLDPEMHECSNVDLLKTDLTSGYEYLRCTVASAGQHYVRVQISPQEATLRLFSDYGFQVFKMLIYAEVEPNDNFESGTEIPLGAFVKGNLSSADQDYYRFSAKAGQQLEIVADDLSDSSLSSITLYRPTTNGLVAVAHSTQSMPTTISKGGHSLFETSYGRIFVAHLFFRILGLEVSPDILGNGLLSCGINIFLPSFLFITLFVPYVALARRLSGRKYDESLAIRYLVWVLQKLDDDDALRSEGKKAHIRMNINVVSDQVAKIPKISRFPFFGASAPNDMEAHMAKTASQFREMNTVVSKPDAESLPSLRRKFTKWLDVFLKGEYGRFQFESGKMVSLPWYRQFLYTLQQQWKKIALAATVVLIAAYITRNVWQPFWFEIATLAWLVVRYIILIIAVYTVYDRWGVRGPGEKPDTKWHNAVRLILFFFVPLFAFDVLLQTGIVENIINLISALKIF